MWDVAGPAGTSHRVRYGAGSLFHGRVITLGLISNTRVVPQSCMERGGENKLETGEKNSSDRKRKGVRGNGAQGQSGGRLENGNI